MSELVRHDISTEINKILFSVCHSYTLSYEVSPSKNHPNNTQFLGRSLFISWVQGRPARIIVQQSPAPLGGQWWNLVSPLWNGSNEYGMMSEWQENLCNSRTAADKAIVTTFCSLQYSYSQSPELGSQCPVSCKVQQAVCDFISTYRFLEWRHAVPGHSTCQWCFYVTQLQEVIHRLVYNEVSSTSLTLATTLNTFFQIVTCYCHTGICFFMYFSGLSVLHIISRIHQLASLQWAMAEPPNLERGLIPQYHYSWWNMHTNVHVLTICS
jgi:hypothetical protein